MKNRDRRQRDDHVDDVVSGWIRGLFRMVSDRHPIVQAALVGVIGVLAAIGFTQLSAGEDPASEPVPRPPHDVAVQLMNEASDSVVFVSVIVCGEPGSLTGFVVADGLVVTAAHGIAGGTAVVEWHGERYPSVPVLFDENLDVAVLRVRGLEAPPLTLIPDVLERGEMGAVIGYPGGGPQETRPAAVRATVDAQSEDIYKEDTVRKRVYVLDATIHPGDSGAPFVLSGERAAGVAVGFGLTPETEDTSLVIPSTDLLPLLERAARSLSASTGDRCVDFPPNLIWDLDPPPP